MQQCWKEIVALIVNKCGNKFLSHLSRNYPRMSCVSLQQRESRRPPEPTHKRMLISLDITLTWIIWL